MRPIDADALKDRLQSIAYDDWNQGVTTSLADAYRECADMVDEQPTIAPERKTGHWIKWGDRVKCDQCALTNKYSKPFCPNCGADMRGEQNE